MLDTNFCFQKPRIWFIRCVCSTVVYEMNIGPQWFFPPPNQKLQNCGFRFIKLCEGDFEHNYPHKSYKKLQTVEIIHIFSTPFKKKRTVNHLFKIFIFIFSYESFFVPLQSWFTTFDDEYFILWSIFATHKKLFS